MLRGVVYIKYGYKSVTLYFLGVADFTGVHSALSRLERDKFIRRLAHGLYDYPRENQSLGTLPPKADDIAKAIAEKNAI